MIHQKNANEKLFLEKSAKKAEKFTFILQVEWNAFLLTIFIGK